MSKPHGRRDTLVFRVILISIFIIAVGAIALSFFVQHNLSAKTDARFDHDTRQVTQNILDRVSRHSSILYNARAFIISSNSLSQASWQTYFSSQKTLETYKGINSISYAELVPRHQKETFEAEVRAEGVFGDSFTIHPTSSDDMYLVARRVIARSDVSKAYGFNNFSSPERRLTYQQAELTGSPQASPPMTFATGSLGFFVALPVTTEHHGTAGFIIMSFHVADLLAFVPESTPTAVSLKITDESDQSSPITLFQQETWDKTPAELTRSDQIIFAGRSWKLEFKSPRAYQDSVLNFAGPRLILFIAGAIILIIVLSYVIYVKHRQLTGKASLK